MRVLGVSAFYHDSAAPLIEDGRIVAAASIGFLMRLTGKDPLSQRYAPEAETYWIKRAPPNKRDGNFP